MSVRVNPPEQGFHTDVRRLEWGECLRLSNQVGDFIVQIFRELLIRGTPEQFASAVARIGRAGEDGWFHDSVMEGRLDALTLSTERTTCFSCTEKSDRPAASLFLTRDNSGSCYASNVVPMTKYQLSHGEYNDILVEFAGRFGEVFRAEGSTVELTQSEADLDHWLSRDVAALLRSFSTKANKGVGGARTIDRERWNAFVVAASREGSTLDGYTLRRWLTEIENWAPEVADRLASEYSFGRELLKFADERRSA